MSMCRAWCGACRGGKDGRWVRCDCGRVYHPECVIEASGAVMSSCAECAADAATASDRREHQIHSKAQTVQRNGRKEHAALQNRMACFYASCQEELAPFIGTDAARALAEGAESSRIALLDGATFSTAPPYVHAELRPYQVEGVRWLLGRYAAGAGGILGDEMGLGKTLQALAFIAHLKEVQPKHVPALIVTPLSVLQNWCNELRRFTPGLSFAKIAGPRAERDADLAADSVRTGALDVYLTTYETLAAEEAFFAESFAWRVVVIDEGHRIKNEAGKLCESLARLPAPFRVLLTGTPLQNSLRELWALLQYLLPQALARNSAAAAFEAGFTIKDGLGDANAILAARKLLDGMMLRRLKSDVEKSLPPKTVVTVLCPLAPLQKAWYLRALAGAERLAEDGALDVISPQQLHTLSLQLQKICNHPKQMLGAVDERRAATAAIAKRAEGGVFAGRPLALPNARPDDGTALEKFVCSNGGQLERQLRDLSGPALLSSSNKLTLLDRLLTRLRERGSRVLVFSQYRACLDVLEEYFQWRFGARGVAYFRLDGQTNRIARAMDVHTFNEPGCTVFAYLISTRAGGMGLNLATADTVILYDSAWNPQVDLQAMDRAHRIGQTKNVRVYRLCCESTLEERIIARTRQKMLLDHAVVRSGDSSADVGVAALQAAMVAAIAPDGGKDAGHDVDGNDVPDLQELIRMLRFGQRDVVSAASDMHRLLGESELGLLIDRAEQATEDALVRPERLEGRRKRIVLSSSVLTDCEVDADGRETETDGAAAPNWPSLAIGTAAAAPQFAFQSVVVEAERELPADVFRGTRVLKHTTSERTKRARRSPQRFRDTQHFVRELGAKKRRMARDSFCFECGQGRGREALIGCSACPKVYHARRCLGLATKPSKSWRCPWHACHGCSRPAALAGGALLHCPSCPRAFCLECSGNDGLRGRQPGLDAERRADLLRAGMPDTASTPRAFVECERCSSRALADATQAAVPPPPPAAPRRRLRVKGPHE